MYMVRHTTAGKCWKHMTKRRRRDWYFWEICFITVRDLPKEYAPKEVIRLLNERKNQIYAVRGNCEAEVDQMVLDFPVMADYCILAIDGKTLYATHGHIYNKDNLPPMMDGDILIHGHTHVLKAENMGNYILLNPGSVSIPKEGNPPTYAILENGIFTIKDFEGNTVREITL